MKRSRVKRMLGQVDEEVKVPVCCGSKIWRYGEKGCINCAKEPLDATTAYSSSDCEKWELERFLGSGAVVVEETGRGKEKVWETEEQEAPCKQTATIYMDYAVHAKIVHLTRAMDNLEWLGYLIGVATDDGYRIDDIIIPKQSVSLASADPKEKPSDEDVPRIVGIIHSHGLSSTDTKPSFSIMDKNDVNNNHGVSIVTNGEGRYDHCIRRKLACGIWCEVKGELRVIYPLVDGLDKFVEEAKSKCERKTYAVTSYYGEGYYGNRWPLGWPKSQFYKQDDGTVLEVPVVEGGP